MIDRDEIGSGGERSRKRASARMARALTVRRLRSLKVRFLSDHERERRLLAALVENLCNVTDERALVAVLGAYLQPVVPWERLAVAVRENDHLAVRGATARAGSGGGPAGGDGLTIPLCIGEQPAGTLLVSGSRLDAGHRQFLQRAAVVVATALIRLQRETALMHRIAKLETHNEELGVLATADSLTGISNRRAFDTALQNEWRRAIRFGSTISLLLIDIDHFKDFNDELGHLAGDACLRILATLLASSVRRAGDFVARIGGEEFGVILPETSLESAEFVANELCRAVRQQALNHPGSPTSPHVTISVGVASARALRGTSPSGLYAAADEALYRAKDSGRDSVSR